MIKLRRLSDYGGKPEDAPRKLRALEDNVFEAVTQLDGAFLPVLAVTRRETNCRAALGELVAADTSKSSITVTGPDPSTQNAGRSFAVVRSSLLNVLQVAVATGGIMGAASDVLPAKLGLYLYVSDGASWWRAP